jgi:phosphatidylinositol alpha-mannosyltransferase
VLLEGMAARTPVVASDLPGYRNVASTGTEALLVPPGDAAALAAALSDVLGNPHRAAALVAAGEPRAEQFAMDRLATTYVDMYERAIELAAARGTVRPVGRGRLRPLLRRRAEEWTGPSVAAARAPAR